MKNQVQHPMKGGSKGKPSTKKFISRSADDAPEILAGSVPSCINAASRSMAGKKHQPVK